MTVEQSTYAGAPRPGILRHRGPAVVGFVLLVVAGVYALSIDVPRTSYGIKSDESTYVAAALSAAFDGDVTYERRDLERFAGLYHQGPEGIFLKRGKQLRISVGAPFPFVHLVKRQDPNPNRLYFGKAVIYPLLAAPFVRFFGLNGLLLFHVLLLALAATAAYSFLAAQSPPIAAAAVTSAFLGASVLPVYGVSLLPELFNFSVIVLGYFFWLFKEVSPQSRLLNGRWTDIAAAILLGIVTYSNPRHAALIAPLALLPLWRRQISWAVTVGAVAVVVAGGLFAVNAAISGEFNYQGGDRKTFYARFPFDAPDASWDRRGNDVTTDTRTPQEVLTSSELPLRFAHNVEYFLVGRHFGFVPYFFPGVVAIAAWLLSSARRDRWRLLTFGGFVVTALALLIITPWTWSGGGGPPGNRYLLSIYPTLLFLMPPIRTALPGMLAWAGGALFTARILMDPFTAAKFTYLLTERGPIRRLPVELTMANDLPMRLAQPLRGHIPYQAGPDGVLLYFLDQNAWPPEPVEKKEDGTPIYGMWVSGSGRADIIVRTVAPIERLVVEAQSPIHTVLTVTMGGEPVVVTLEPKKIVRFDIPASGVRGFNDHDYLLTTRSSDGFIPHLSDPQSSDYRNLGARLSFYPIVK